MAQRSSWGSRRQNQPSNPTVRELDEDDFRRTARPTRDRMFSPIYDERPSTRPVRTSSRTSSASSGTRASSSGQRNAQRGSREERSYARPTDQRPRRTNRPSWEEEEYTERQSRPSQPRGNQSRNSYNDRPTRASSHNERRGTQRSNTSRSGQPRSGQGQVRGRRTGAVIQKEAPKKKRLFNLPERAESNFTIIAVTIVLMFIGLIMITSSSYSYAYSTFDDSLYFFWRQFMWIGVGLVAMVFMTYFPLRLIRQASFALYLFSILCSVLVLFIGNTANGSTRWLGVGNMSFQPAELAKLAVAIHVSSYVDRNHDKMGTMNYFLRTLALVAIPTALVGYENLSSGLIIGVMGVIVMFVGGAKIEHFIKVVLPVFILLVLVLVVPLMLPEDSLPGFMADFLYRSNRIKAWLNPWDYSLDEGYQTIQALYAVGSGGFFGRGLGQSIQKLGYIPEAYNDIIFAIVCEELGAFGAGLIILLFGVYTWNGAKIAIMAPNTFTSLVASAIVGQISVQAILNIAVNTNSIPATGISLPFISYGGSSLLFLMASVGILLNISTYANRNATL